MLILTQTNNDSEVIHRIIDGDVNAFETIVEKYKRYVFSIVRRHVPEAHVEDTVQDVFIRIYKALPGFEERSGFKCWMSSVVIKTCYDLLRKKYRSRETTFSSLMDKDQARFEKKLADQASENYTDKYALDETRKTLTNALERLSPENKMIMELIYFEGYSVKETAGLLGWSVANVKIRSFRSRQQLNTILKPIYSNP